MSDDNKAQATPDLARRNLIVGAGLSVAAAAALQATSAVAQQAPAVPPPVTPPNAVPPQTTAGLSAPLPPREKLGGPGELRGPSPIRGTGQNANDPTLLRGPYLDLTTPRGNREAYARLMANLDMTKTKYGWYSGVVLGVRPGEAVRDLVGFCGFSCAKLLPNDGPDGGYKKVLVEVGYYTDLRSGEIIEEWRNPYFNETVKIVPIANDPFNHTITDFRPEAPTYGGLNQVRRERTPFILPFTRRGSTLNLFSSINLFYPSALRPAIWRRENGNPMAQVTEAFSYQIPWADMQDRRKTSVEYTGTWNRITPWLPWMLMGTTPGNCNYTAFMGAYDDINRIDRRVLDYTAKNFPKFLEAPERWTEPSHSSLEWYSRSQYPAPVAEGQSLSAPPPELPAWMRGGGAGGRPPA